MRTAAIPAMLAIAITGSVQAQAVKVGVKNTALNVDIPRYEVSKETEGLLHIRMPYGGWQLDRPERLERIEDRPIERIDLIYTDYPPGKDMDELNNRRLAALYISAPWIFKQRYVEWRMVRQTDCVSDHEASRMFHGFAIRYRPEGSPALARSEADYIRRYVENVNSPKPDSTVLKVMGRNSWEDMVIVADLTGSMSPYAAQLLLWFKLTLHEQRTHGIVFFNDGDMRPDANKTIGSTGGIYSGAAKDFESAMQLAETTMMAGFGGDTPENNLEALLHAMDKWPDAKELVMIADNFSTPRDMALLDRVKVPVRVVLCGTHAGMNPAYLRIARETGGSLHTMEEDIEDLVKLRDGSRLTIGSQVFLIQKGQFVKLAGS